MGISSEILFNTYYSIHIFWLLHLFKQKPNIRLEILDRHGIFFSFFILLWKVVILSHKKTKFSFMLVFLN